MVKGREKMRIGRLAFTGLALISFVVAPGFAQAEGDQDNGAELAAEWCERCHDIQPDGAFKQHPPSFTAIAIYRSEDQIYGRIAISPIHSIMPQMGYVLTTDNINDLVAYIVSLEK